MHQSHAAFKVGEALQGSGESVSQQSNADDSPQPVNDDVAFMPLVCRQFGMLQRWQQFGMGLLVVAILFLMGKGVYSLVSCLGHSKDLAGGDLLAESQRPMPRGLLSGAAREIREGLIEASTHLGDGGVPIGSGIASAGRDIGHGISGGAGNGIASFGRDIGRGIGWGLCTIGVGLCAIAVALILKK